MRRRAFITLLGGATAFVWPLAARAQQPDKVIRIGILGPSLNSVATAANYNAFLAELGKHGFKEGQNLVIEYRRVDDSRGPFVAAGELMRLQVDLIVADGPEVALQAVIGASRSIPIVIQAVNYDPIERGYIDNLARPGGNITGFFYRQPELAQKQVELLTQAFPQKTLLGMLWDEQSDDQFNAAEAAAKSIKLNIRPQKLTKLPHDFAAAFRALAQDGAQMVLVLSSPFFTEFRPQIADAAIQHRLPTMFIFKSYVEVGGLMSYGVDRTEMSRRTGEYVSRILSGSKPADLPVERATKFELVINLKTAKAIGIEFSTAILVRADQVIE